MRGSSGTSQAQGTGWVVETSSLCSICCVCERKHACVHVAIIIVNLTQPLASEMANSCDYPAAEIPLTVTWLHLTAFHFLGQDLSRENAFPSGMLQPKEPGSTLGISLQRQDKAQRSTPQGDCRQTHTQLQIRPVAITLLFGLLGWLCGVLCLPGRFIWWVMRTRESDVSWDSRARNEWGAISNGEAGKGRYLCCSRRPGEMVLECLIRVVSPPASACAGISSDTGGLAWGQRVSSRKAGAATVVGLGFALGELLI